MALPKFELRITVPTGGWALQLTDADGGPVALTFPAGDYYMNSVAPLGTLSFLAQLALTLTNGAGVTYTAVADDNADGSIGKITITVSSGTFTITWTNTALRDQLGFTGSSTASSGTSAVSPNQCRGLWLPNQQREPEDPDPVLGEASQDFGRPETDYIVTRSPSGAVNASVYSTRWSARIVFPMLWGQRYRLSLEQVVNESLERFYGDCMLAGGAPFRYHNDRGNDALSWTERFDAAMAKAFEAPPNVKGWVGPRSQWRVELPVVKHVAVNGR